jgi:hypothetical protein
MSPGPLALHHPAAPLLQTFATAGCPVDITDQWTLAQLEEVIAYGSHPSAQDPVAAKACRTEALEKVAQGFCKVIPWSELRAAFVNGYCPNLKLSPIAAIPHKSRLFRMILDLSAKAKRRRQNPPPAVNESTRAEAAPLHSMAQLGKVIPRFIQTIATAPLDEGPLLFAKLDIKDGFWRLCVPAEAAHHFCYPLPKLTADEPTQVVIPPALQMGWVSSPPFFCAATETGRDIAEWLRLFPSLPPHELEQMMLPSNQLQFLQHLLKPQDWPQEQLPDMSRRICYLLEVYMDDYCALLQSTDPQIITHHSRALLHAIHQIFPADPSQDPHQDAISYKKLVSEHEGVWTTRKEILGWIMDGINRTIELPPKKVETILSTIKKCLRRQHAESKAFQSLVGKLTHATLGLPTGRSLMAPLYKLAAIAQHQATVQIHHNSTQALALRDLAALLRTMAHRPTKCSQLVPQPPAYIGNVDACKYGVGGCWLPVSQALLPVVWRYKWPDDISQAVDDHTLTINDLEMAGILLHWLVLELLVPTLVDTHVAIWCDNTSAVAWSRKLSSTRSKAGNALARALAMRICVTQSSPLTPFHIQGTRNDMADLPSRSFHEAGPGNYNWSDTEFLTHYNARFPLSQDASWKMLRLPNSF